MKNDLLPYYERELIFIRQLAAEFAKTYPDVAGRLQLRPDEIEDPHVERLIEAFALIAGRIHHKLDDEFPEITESLLGMLYPHYLRPIPPMSVVQFEIDPEASKASGGYGVKRNTMLFTEPNGGAPCAFRTNYPVTLWPIEVASASFLRSSSAGLAATAGDAAAVIRLEIQCQGGLRFSALDISSLRFFLGAEPQISHLLYELLFNNVLRVIVRGGPPGAKPEQFVLPSNSIREVGFGVEDAMLPYSDRSFIGYRLLQEYFSFPQKFLFMDLSGLDSFPKARWGDRFEIHFLLSDFERKDRWPLLHQAISADTFQLGCTPAVNLYERCAEPIRVSHAQSDYRVIPDIHFPLSTEVYSVDRVTSTVPYSEEPQVYEPFYSLRHVYGRDGAHAFWNTSRRQSERKDDRGSEVYLSVLNLDFQPHVPPTETLTVHVTCTNRDQVEKMSFGREFGELDTETSAMLRTRFVLKPTPALRPSARRGLQWSLISHLGLNYLSITEGGVEALQEILTLYDFSDDAAVRRQITGITRIASQPEIARVVSENGVVFTRGIRVSAEMDEEQFVGSGVFLFASVLEKFFGLYSSINSFSQLSMSTKQRKGVVKTWPPRSGEQIVL